MLVLAGISIAALSGENGLIKRAANAKENTEIAELSNNSNIQGIAEGSKGIEVTFKNGRVHIVDTDGNVTYKEPKVYTTDVKDKLKIEGRNSPWVNFANNDPKYRVLYDESNPYGIEIISATNMGTGRRSIWSIRKTTMGNRKS